MTITRLIASFYLIAHAGVARADAAACVEKYFGATVKDGVVTLPGGRTLPWDDGRTKTMAERVEEADVEDLFQPPYRAGAIRPVTDPEEDPGRARVEALFEAAYPKTGLRTGTFLGQKVRLHEKALAALARVEARLGEAAQPLRPLGGTYNDRVIAGTTRRSAHAFGLAIDVNPKISHYWRWEKGGAWKNRIPQAVVDAFEAEGFIWGGRWYHFDTMHFEYRPELLDPACR